MVKLLTPFYRLFEVKHLQRKVENQIKMAKMVLVSEINKRANVLLEQLEVSGEVLVTKRVDTKHALKHNQSRY